MPDNHSLSVLFALLIYTALLIWSKDKGSFLLGGAALAAFAFLASL